MCCKKFVFSSASERLEITKNPPESVSEPENSPVAFRGYDTPDSPSIGKKALFPMPGKNGNNVMNGKFQSPIMIFYDCRTSTLNICDKTGPSSGAQSHGRLRRRKSPKKG
ncbi:hypothetical protein [Methanospirillum hungatei]|uniref:hypothetical protein n=1 Tax=Methanospirillum hungatei TaxID=2203 RepID=UPI0026EDC633|nr:hypothetical protein [Methanospirillum hungatei]MCA1915144.1 hypothetical protein [Methanospirillum hungatei]